MANSNILVAATVYNFYSKQVVRARVSIIVALDAIQNGKAATYIQFTQFLPCLSITTFIHPFMAIALPPITMGCMIPRRTIMLLRQQLKER
jgi:hypothetical protein